MHICIHTYTCVYIYIYIDMYIHMLYTITYKEYRGGRRGGTRPGVPEVSWRYICLLDREFQRYMCLVLHHCLPLYVCFRRGAPKVHVLPWYICWIRSYKVSVWRSITRVIYAVIWWTFLSPGPFSGAARSLVASWRFRSWLVLDARPLPWRTQTGYGVTVLCYGMVCCVMLCYVMLCYVML